jgi:biopolymer transport protein ExbD
VRADRGVAYGDLMDVLELLRRGNYRMKLVTLEGVPDQASPAPAPGAVRP